MSKRRLRRQAPYEIYELDRSPFSQRPTQKDLADLAGVSKPELLRQLWYKETCIVRRDVEINGKDRNLAYPTGPLRATHERFKYHLNKVKQPNYLISPRKGKSQRDNAVVHLKQNSFLSIDIRQFYPSTTYHMIRKWCVDDLGMYDDVARLFAGLSTVDDRASFGSPLTPILITLVHRKIFEQIFQHCEKNNLAMSLWVDDLTISGQDITGKTIRTLRKIISDNGLKSHKVKIRTGNKIVFITGVGVSGAKLVAPRILHEKIRDYWTEYHQAKTLEEKESISQRLLSLMGTVRHINGKKTAAGQKLANRMNSLRQEILGLHLRAQKLAKEAVLENLNTIPPDHSHPVPWT